MSHSHVAGDVKKDNIGKGKGEEKNDQRRAKDSALLKSITDRLLLKERC